MCELSKHLKRLLGSSYGDGDVDPPRFVCPEFSKSEIETVIEALETTEGIEKLSSQHPTFELVDGVWFVELHDDDCGNFVSLNETSFRSAVCAAVDAARKYLPPNNPGTPEGK